MIDGPTTNSAAACARLKNRRPAPFLSTLSFHGIGCLFRLFLMGNRKANLPQKAQKTHTLITLQETEISMLILGIHVNSQLIPRRGEGKRGVDRPDSAEASRRACNFIADTIHCPIENQEQEMPSHRFTHCFFTDGIKSTAEWRTSLSQPETFAALRDGHRSTRQHPGSGRS